jgi:hypothetical protein
MTKGMLGMFAGHAETRCTQLFERDF